MSLNSKSGTATPPLSINLESKEPTILKKKKKREEEEEGLSKDYKKPRKLKQLHFQVDPTPPELPKPVYKKPPTATASVQTEKPLCLEDIIIVRDTLERVIARQDRAQECIDHLLRLILQEGPGDSSGDEVPPSKVR